MFTSEFSWWDLLAVCSGQSGRSEAAESSDHSHPPHGDTIPGICCHEARVSGGENKR